MKKFVIIGAALSGNKGAAGMVAALVQNLHHRHPDARFTLMSYFPEQDRKLNRRPDLEIISGTPLGLIALFPLAVVASLMKRRGRVPDFLKRHPGIKAVSECDLFLDAGGVSFVDGREKFIPFNILWVFAPLALHKPVVKAPQALGPFKNRFNRICARIILPRIDLICARGEKTAEFLRGIGVNNYKPFPDIAFTLKETDIREEVVARYEFPNRGKRLVGISPSQVVCEKCEKKGIDYPGVIARFADRLLSENYDVALLPHSARAGSNKTRNNDLPVLEKIYSHMEKKESVIKIDEEMTPSELRLLIGKFDLFVASRFHAMISALCVKVPTLVLGWSHKYREILKAFDIEDAALDFSRLGDDLLWKSYKDLEKNADSIREKIDHNLAPVIEWSGRFYDEIAPLAGFSG